jgi:diketogulonate reductase-like aldo/keto reductase
VYTKDDEYFPKKDGILQLDFETNIVEIWRSMEAQVDAKRTRSIGLSNFNQEQILRILQFSRIPPVNLQVYF